MSIFSCAAALLSSHDLQDGDDAAVKAVLERYQANGQLKFLQFAPKTLLCHAIIFKMHGWRLDVECKLRLKMFWACCWDLSHLRKLIGGNGRVWRFLPSGYKRLSAHYAWALAQIFDVSGHAAGRHVGLKVLGKSVQLLVAWAFCWGLLVLWRSLSDILSPARQPSQH